MRTTIDITRGFGSDSGSGYDSDSDGMIDDEEPPTPRVLTLFGVRFHAKRNVCTEDADANAAAEAHEAAAVRAAAAAHAEHDAADAAARDAVQKASVAVLKKASRDPGKRGGAS